MAVIVLISYIITTSSGLVMLKLGTRGAPPVVYANGKIHLHLTPYFIGGLVLYLISFSLYTYLISKFDLGFIIPLTAAFVYVIIFFASYYIFNETFTVLKLIGIALIISGIVALGIGK